MEFSLFRLQVSSFRFSAVFIRRVLDLHNRLAGQRNSWWDCRVFSLELEKWVVESPLGCWALVHRTKSDAIQSSFSASSYTSLRSFWSFWTCQAMPTWATLWRLVSIRRHLIDILEIKTLLSSSHSLFESTASISRPFMFLFARPRRLMLQYANLFDARRSVPEKVDRSFFDLQIHTSKSRARVYIH